MSYLIAVDDGFPIMDCFEVLRRFSADMQTTCHLVSVVDIPHLAATYHQIPEIPYDSIIRDARAHYTNLHIQLIEQFKQAWPQVEFVSHIKEGFAAFEVLELAHQLKASTLFCGARGLGSVKKFLLGSVSSQIVAQTDIPTIVIKGQSQGNKSIDADLNAKGPRPFRLAFASDGSEAAARACDYLIKNLQSASCIKVFSSVTKNRFFQSEPLSQIRYWESVKNTIKSNLTAQTLPLKEKTSQFSIEVEESAESPAQAIEGFVQVEKIDMIAFGKTGRSAFKRVFLGSVATHLASQLPCHALVVP